MSEMRNAFVSIFQENPIAQVIGFVAVGINIVAFATAKDKKFLIFMAISSGIWGLHFGLMGLLSAAEVSFLDVIKNIAALKYKKHSKMMTGFLVAYILIGFFTYESGNIISLIPILNAVLSIYFIFYLKGAKLKIGFLVILLLWFAYNYTGHSLGGMTSDSILFISGLFGLYRILMNNKSKKTDKKNN